MQRFKKFLSTAVTVTTISWSIGLGTLIPLLPARANPAGSVTETITSLQQTLGANTATSVLKFNVSATGETLSSVFFGLAALNGTNLSSILADMSQTGSAGGLAVAREINAPGANATYSNADTNLNLSETPQITIKTLSRFSDPTNTGTYSTDGSGILSGTPTINVGDAVFVVNTAIDASTNDQKMFGVVTQAGGAAFQVNGASIGNSKTLKITRWASSGASTYGVSGGNTIVPAGLGSGNYNTPSNGDFVFYGTNNGNWSDSGIITNNTLTNGSGTFAINGQALSAASYYIARVTGFSATTFQLTGASKPSIQKTLSAGQVIKANTGQGYQWYTVTTSGTFNADEVASTFRLNDVATLQSFAASSYVTVLTPTSSALANDTQTQITAGDIIFGNDYKNGSSNGVAPLFVTTGTTAGFSSSLLRVINSMVSGGPLLPFWYGFTLTVSPGQNIPSNDADGGPDYYIVVRSRSTGGGSGTLMVAVPGNGGLTSSGGQLSLGGGAPMIGVNTLTINLDSTPPTATGAGGPPDTQRFVPTFPLVDRTFNEALANATVTNANVSLKQCTGTESGDTDGAKATAACGASGTTVGGNTNLCTASLDGTARILCTLAAPLAVNTWYSFVVSAGVTDASGNPFAPATNNGIYRFKTSEFSGGDGGNFNVAPNVMQSFPNMGSMVPISASFSLTFSLGPEGNLKTGAGTAGSVVNPAQYSLFQLTSAGAQTGSNLCAGSACTFTWDATNRRVIIAHPVLTAGSGYQLTVTGLQNQNNAAMPTPFNVMFAASTGAADTTPPTVRANCGNALTEACTFPQNSTTGISQYQPEFTLNFSEGLDPSTVTLSTVSLYNDDGSGGGIERNGIKDGTEALLTGSALAINYDSNAFMVRLSNKAALADTSAAGQYCFYVLSGGSGVKDLSGNAVQTTSQNKCFRTTATSDSAAPNLTFADADNFKLVAHFSEPMMVADLITGSSVNTTNVALACPVGVTLSLTNKPATWRGGSNELEIQSLGLTNGQDCRLTVTSARDLAGNAIDTTNSNNVANFKIQDSATTGGNLGSGGAVSGGGFFGGMTGETAGTFWEQPKRCQPRTNATNKSTSLECEFPAPAGTTLASGSQFILTLPTGFTLSGTSTIDGTTGATRAIAASKSFMNNDINGPAANAPAIASVSPSGSTITITTGTASIAGGDMIHFELDRLTTPTTPSSDLRISIIIKDASGVKIGQTIQPAPFSIAQGGALSISGKVCKGSSSGGTCGGSDTAVASAKIFCDQMGGFVQGSTASGFMGHQETTSAGDGTWTISGLVAGSYGCGMPPQPGLAALQDTGGTPPFQQISLSTLAKTGADFKVKDLAAQGAGGKTLTINITGPASTDLDVFCNAGMSSYEFSAPVMKQVTLDGAGSGTTTLTLQGGKTYECGTGPHMAFEQFGNGAPPPPPTFTFMPPKPQQVVVPTDTNPTALTFSLLSASLTINVTVQDGSGNGIGNVYVHAAPVGCFDETTGAQKDCFGSFAQANPSGVAALKVGKGTYEVGADGPGLPQSTREIVTITSGTASVTLKMTKSSTTISGQILDESGNGIKYAHVNAEKRTITSGTDACDFSNSRPSGGFADSPTDESGNFTLYAATGTWCVRAFSPSYGEVGTKTVTVASGTSQTGQNIQASTGNFGTISGTVRKGGSTVGGAFINCFSPGTGGNGSPTNADGTFSLKVKLPSSGTATYTCDGFAPGIGQLERQTTTLGGGTTTRTVDFTTGNPATITVTIANITDAFCDARDTNGFGAPGGRASSTGVYTINVPAGTYTVRCGGPKYGSFTLSSSSVTVTAGGTAAITGTAPTVRTVRGRITDSSANLAGASLTFTDTSGKSFTTTTGAQTDTTCTSSVTTGCNLSLSGVPEGTYTVTASKKSYKPASTTATVSGGNLTLSSPIALTPATGGTTGVAVSIPVQADAAAYTGSANVIATKTTGEIIVAAIDATTGNASLPLANGTYSVKAVGDNGKESSSSTVTIANGAISGSTPTLSLANSISGYTQKSGSETMSLSGGGLAKFSDLAVAGKTPEINVPASTLSTTDSSTGKIEMKSDPTLKDIDPGTNANFVGSYGYDITPKDANGNAITTGLNGSVTITVPYTDADVTAAGVSESELKFGSFNTSSQAWETFPTTVDTTNNLLTAQITHFSSFGILGTVSTTAASSSIDLNPPASPSNVKATSDGSKVTLTWTDPSDSDLSRILVLRNNGGTTPISGDPYEYVSKGIGTFVDTQKTTPTSTRGVTKGETYKYILRAQDSAGNADANITSVSVTVTAGASVSAPAPSTTPPPATPPVTTPPAVTSPPATTPPAACSSSTAGCALQPSKVMESAAEFGIALNSADESALSGFVANGTSESAKKLGSGERLAVVRDILETLGRASLRAIEQISAGEKPTDRNLTKEQAQVNKALPLFKKMLGVSRGPNFKNANEDLAWNTLMYRIRFDRDLKKEQKGIVRFKKVMGKNPSSPLDWAAVRAYGYKLAK